MRRPHRARAHDQAAALQAQLGEALKRRDDHADAAALLEKELGKLQVELAAAQLDAKVIIKMRSQAMRRQGGGSLRCRCCGL